jgi:hypothetical protein
MSQQGERLQFIRDSLPFWKATISIDTAGIQNLVGHVEWLQAQVEALTAENQNLEFHNQQLKRFHTGLMDAFKAAGVPIGEGRIPEGKSLAVLMVETLAARAEAAEQERDTLKGRSRQ